MLYEKMDLLIILSLFALSIMIGNKNRIDYYWIEEPAGQRIQIIHTINSKRGHPNKIKIGFPRLMTTLFCHIH